MIMKNNFEIAADIIKKSSHCIVFSGAGISVESGIPPFRGEGGLWTKYDPSFIELDNFYREPEKCWIQIKKIFYDFMGVARPNSAHTALAELQQAGYIKEIITQNIDNLHQMAGSTDVYEFHGNTRMLICTGCSSLSPVTPEILSQLPPVCSKCGDVLKPDFIFFGEDIPGDVYSDSLVAARQCDAMIIVGASGEVMPAGNLPYIAKRAGASIIEVNTLDSNYTGALTDIFLQGKAGETMDRLKELVLTAV